MAGIIVGDEAWVEVDGAVYRATVHPNGWVDIKTIQRTPYTQLPFSVLKPFPVVID